MFSGFLYTLTPKIPFGAALFKAHSSYYAYVQINQWILDAGTLYEYNPKSNILRKLCDFDGKEVINISH